MTPFLLILGKVIVGTIAIRGLQLGFEPQPLREFELACATFKEAALTSNRAARAMVGETNFTIICQFI